MIAIWYIILSNEGSQCRYKEIQNGVLIKGCNDDIDADGVWLDDLCVFWVGDYRAVRFWGARVCGFRCWRRCCCCARNDMSCYSIKYNRMKKMMNSVEVK